MRNVFFAAVAAISLTVPAWAGETVRGVTDNEIVIGNYSDLSGITAMRGVDGVNAYRMAFNEINAEGGINGRKIRYVVEDMQYQVPRAVQAANKLINSDKAFIMVANTGTPMNNATLPEQLAKGVPNIFPASSARSMFQPLHHMKFAYTASYYDMERAGVKLFAQTYGKKRFCAMSQDTDYGRDVVDGASDQLRAMDMQLVAETKHKPTDTDFSAAITKLRDADCDLILLATTPRDTVQIVSAARKLGWYVDMLGNEPSYDLSVANAPGGTTEGLYVMAATLYVDPGDPRPAVHEFAAKFEKLYGHLPNITGEIDYSEAQLLILALQRAGRDLTADSFIAALESIKDYQDIFGSPIKSFSATKHLGSSEAFLAQVKSGNWVQVGSESYGY
jgi:branched-chain amino acid transport system substrate-binding protein